VRREATIALEAAREASALIMGVYAAPFDVEYKAKDDPVTRADKEANALLVERLSRAFPGLPIVAEESDPASYAAYKGADAAWFVDPLDGTREFVARNGEFAVMLGLAERGRATLGVIVAPAWNRAFVGVVGEGAWEVAPDGALTPIHVTTRPTLAGASVVVSRSRAPARVEAFVASLGDGGAARAVPHGSSGLKGVLVATGVHDVYLQPGRAGMRWDACATEALVIAAGGKCTEASGAPFDYANDEIVNARGLVATNGLLHDAVLRAYASRERGEPSPR
jgi:3'(2'), 5'-bisphosphate nucleotidase